MRLAIGNLHNVNTTGIVIGRLAAGVNKNPMTTFLTGNYFNEFWNEHCSVTNAVVDLAIVL